jgi:tetratricopeptide (TPR) repeat protein
MAAMNTMNTSTTRALAFLVLAIAIVAGGYVYQNSRDAALAVVPNIANATSSAQFSAVAPGQETSGGTTSIIPISAEATFKAPKYPETLSFTGTYSTSDKTALQGAYKQAVDAIAKDRLDFNAWMSLGTINLMAGNIAKAQEIWSYGSTQWPTNVVSHNNLGDLYMNYVRDYAKADAEFKLAIVNKPKDPNPYKNLFTLYSETSYKPTNTAAEDILKQGIAAVPTSVDMQVLLARWYKKLDRAAEAKATYQAAIDNATKLGETQLATQIKAEAGSK